MCDEQPFHYTLRPPKPSASPPIVLPFTPLHVLPPAFPKFSIMTHSKFRLYVTLFAAALSSAHAAHLTLRQDASTHTISVYRDNVVAPILTQNAKPDFRPYLHPIVSPDGKSVLTEFSPGHHKHQTGIYWGLTRVNGRDYFHNPANGYWRRVSSEILAEHGSTVKWSTLYHMLDAAGQPVSQ